MCSVSVVQDYFRGNTKVNDWDRETFNKFQLILQRLDELDEKFGEPDCEDPAKAAWMREVEARLAELEKSE